MLGYLLDSPDNDSFAFQTPTPRSKTKRERIVRSVIPDFRDAISSGVRRCPGCGELIAKCQEPLNGLIINDRRYDISCTYDGVFIVSQRFKHLYEQETWSGLVFRQLPDDVKFYGVCANQFVLFDAKKRKTRFGDKCPQCQQHIEVIGADPVFLKAGQNIPRCGFAQTDLEFGSGDEKHSLILCGPVVGEKLKKAKLKGLTLEPIE